MRVVSPACCTGEARVLTGNGLGCSFNNLEETSPPLAQALARKGIQKAMVHSGNVVWF